MALSNQPNIYDDDGDHLMQEVPVEAGQIILVPDTAPSRSPDLTPRLRIMWGQHLLDDLIAGRYRSLLCAVNSQDNSRGMISQLAEFLPTSQWDVQSITEYARHFDSPGGKVKVLKYDMDTVEVLAVLRPAGHGHLTLAELSTAFRLAVQMTRSKPGRLPSASVSFLEARANVLVDQNGQTPTFRSRAADHARSGVYGRRLPVSQHVAGRPDRRLCKVSVPGLA